MEKCNYIRAQREKWGKKTKPKAAKQRRLEQRHLKGKAGLREGRRRAWSIPRHQLTTLLLKINRAGLATGIWRRKKQISNLSGVPPSPFLAPGNSPKCVQEERKKIKKIKPTQPDNNITPRRDGVALTAQIALLI